MLPLNAARTPMNRADADDALHRLRAEGDTISPPCWGWRNVRADGSSRAPQKPG